MNKPLRVHVLIDLEWSPAAGGHVKCWERFAQAALAHPMLDLTLHVAGAAPRRHDLGRNVRFHVHRPVFSTRNLPFLGHVPDHTDLGTYHPLLAADLAQADLVHTTDAFFNYARTAERIARATGLPLTHSVHTDTVAYTALFTRSMLEKWGVFGRFLNERAQVPQRAAADMQDKLMRHMMLARAVAVSRDEDEAAARAWVRPQSIHRYRLGVDFTGFSPARRNVAELRKRFKIPDAAMILMFVGRLDEGKNIYNLVEAVAAARAKGAAIFLLAAGQGPARSVIMQKLHGHAAAPGILNAAELAACYASADYLALPSEVETWSMAAAEALASGLPVMASEKSGVARFIQDGAGILVKDGSVASWTGALQKAYAKKDDPSRRDQALRAAQRHFPGWEQAFAEDFVPLWRNAAGIAGD